MPPLNICIAAFLTICRELNRHPSGPRLFTVILIIRIYFSRDSIGKRYFASHAELIGVTDMLILQTD
jgi:hypothetical protein